MALTVVAGTVQEVVGWTTAAVLTPLQVHVGGALLTVPLLVTHLVTHWQRPRRTDAARRAVLSTGLLAVGGLAAVVGVDRLTRGLGLPGAQDRATGSTEEGSFRPGRMPVTQWFADTVPGRAEVDLALRVVAAGCTCSTTSPRWRTRRSRRCSTAPTVGTPASGGAACRWTGCCHLPCRRAPAVWTSCP